MTWRVIAAEVCGPLVELLLPSAVLVHESPLEPVSVHATVGLFFTLVTVHDTATVSPGDTIEGLRVIVPIAAGGGLHTTGEPPQV